MRELLAGFTIIRMTHLEKFVTDKGRRCHCFVLARKD